MNLKILVYFLILSRINEFRDICLIKFFFLSLFFQRRGGISFDRADKTALYVRMLGE